MDTVKSPGKFQGEPTYVEHLWWCSLDGTCDEVYTHEGRLVIVCYVTPQNRVTYPDLTNVAVVIMSERDDGFVDSRAFATEGEYLEWRANACEEVR